MKVFSFFVIILLLPARVLMGVDLLGFPKELCIGISEFRSRVETLPKAQAGQALGRIFLENLQSLDQKRITDAEQEAFVKGLLHRRTLTEWKKIDELVLKRDQIALSASFEKNKSTYVDLTSRLEESKKTLRKIEDLKLALPRVEEPIPLRWIEANVKGELLPPPQSTLREACISHNLDYLITGEVEEIFPGVFSIRTIFYGALSDKILLNRETIGTLGEFEALLKPLIAELAVELLGSEWANLEIQVDPKDAGIFLNGKLIGIGKIHRPFLPIGTYRLEIQRQGFEPWVEELVLIPKERVQIQRNLSVIPSSPLSITSIPEGAAVYLGAERRGTTPHVEDSPWEGGIGRLEKEGYKGYVFPLRLAQSEQVAILPKDIIPWQDRIDKKRESFYKALGWFVLSIPIPVLLYGYYENESFKYIQYKQQAGYSESQSVRMADRLNGIYYGYLSSLFLSGSLLVNTLIYLFDYIQTGESSVMFPQINR